MAVPLQNLTATTDPLITSDSAAGYAAGSIWVNTTGKRIWECTSATVGAAVWVNISATAQATMPVNTAITTVGAGTLTAAAITGGVITRSGSTANFSDATDTATAIIALMQNPVVINNSFELTLINTTAWNQTITAGVGVTLSGLTAVIAGNCWARALVTYTGAGAVSIQIFATGDRGIDNLSAVTDPVAGSDNTLGYGVGSLWFNTTLSRSWECMSAATGAATWVFSGAVPGTGYEPNNVLSQAGGSTGTFPPEGNVSRQSSLAGVGNGADTTDDVLFTYSLPASAFDVANRQISVTAWGSFAANNNNKRVRLWFGATIIADTGIIGAPSNGVGWNLLADVTKVGAGGSNTQKAQGQMMWGAVHGGCTLPSAPVETESGAIVIKCTGASTTTGAANDVLGNYFSVNFMN